MPGRVTLRLKNPHSILAALEQRPQDVREVRLPPQGAEAWELVGEVARSAGVRVTTARAPTGTERAREKGRGGKPGAKSGRVGGGEALVSEVATVPLPALFADADPATPGLWLALDCLQDPHNVGAIFRTAAFFGVRGVLLTQDRAAPVTATVYDTAAGGVEYVPVAVETNLARSLEAAKAAGVWVLGSSEHATLEAAAVGRDRPWLLVVGNEAEGMRRLTVDHCDEVCRIAPQGRVTSLNASVAAGVLIAQLSGALG